MPKGTDVMHWWEERVQLGARDVGSSPGSQDRLAKAGPGTSGFWFLVHNGRVGPSTLTHPFLFLCLLFTIHSIWALENFKAIWKLPSTNEVHKWVMGTLVTVHFIDGKTEALGQERTDDLFKEIGMDEGRGGMPDIYFFSLT